MLTFKYKGKTCKFQKKKTHNRVDNQKVITLFGFTLYITNEKLNKIFMPSNERKIIINYLFNDLNIDCVLEYFS